MNIITLSCMYGRHETVLKAVATWKQQNMKFIMVVSNIHDELFCDKNGIPTTYAPNQPLTHKWQHGVDYIRANYKNIDGILIMGSDDIITGYDNYFRYLKKGYEFIHIKDAYIFDSVTGKTKYWKGYRGARKNDGGGAGRLLSTSLLNKMNWQLWIEPLPKYIDGELTRNMAKFNFRSIRITAQDVKITDIKDAGSLTPFDRF